MRNQVLVIIPAFNEEKNIEQVILEAKRLNGSVDYLVVNDCSTDNTEQILREKNIPHISLPINLGIGGAVQAGYRYAHNNGYDVAIQLDGDGQHDSSYLSVMIEEIEEGADVVIGSRYLEKKGFQSSVLRRIGIRLLSEVIWLCTGKRIKDVTSGFRAINRRYIELYSKDYPQDYPEPEAIVYAAVKGGIIKEIPVVMRERKNGKTSIGGVWKAAYYMIKVTLAIFLCRASVKRGV